MDSRGQWHPSDQELRKFSNGRLDDGRSESINNHLLECPACQRRVSEMSSDSFLGRLRKIIQRQRIADATALRIYNNVQQLPANCFGGLVPRWLPIGPTRPAIPLCDMFSHAAHDRGHDCYRPVARGMKSGGSQTCELTAWAVRRAAQTASFSSFAGRKAIFLLALIFMASPVAGFRPILAARFRTWRMPRPVRRILSPFLRCRVVSVTRSPSTASACFFGRSWLSDNEAARCLRVMVGLAAALAVVADFLAEGAAFLAGGMMISLS